MAGRIGIHEVALAAGVSTTTVSHALNGRGKVSPGTRERVRRVALELGYQPNRIASALRGRRTGVIGFVSDEIASQEFAGGIIAGAQAAAAARGMTLMLVDSNDDPAVEQQQIEVLRAQQADAILYATMYHRVVSAPVVGRTPVVLVNAVDPAGRAPSVVPDEEGAGRTAARELLDAGHRRIVHLTLTDERQAVDGRVAGFAAAVAEAGLPARVVRVPGPGDADAGRRAMRRALAEFPDLTAVFSFNDPMAMGVYQVAAEHGIGIPSRVSVVSVDDLALIAAQLRPALTTLRLPHAAMGRWAVETALRRLEAPAEPVEHARLPAPVVRRASIDGPG